MFFAALAVYAEKSADYVAPSFVIRLLRSIVFVAPCGAVLAAVLYLVQLQLHHRRVERIRRVRYWQAVAVLVFIGAALAAADALNDEGWNPANAGAIGLAPLLAVGILVLTPERPTVAEWIVAVALTPFFFIGLRVLLFLIQENGFDLSW